MGGISVFTIKIKESEIVDERTVCPYCMNDVNQEGIGCCGESRDHFERAYITKDGEAHLVSECEVVNEPA
jgi:hypothetical protein